MCFVEAAVTFTEWESSLINNYKYFFSIIFIQERKNLQEGELINIIIVEQTNIDHTHCFASDFQILNVNGFLNLQLYKAASIQHPFTIQRLFSFKRRNFIIFFLEFLIGELLYQLKTLKEYQNFDGILHLKSFIVTSNLKTSFSTYLDIFTYLKFILSKVTNHSQSLNGSKKYINPEMPLKLETKYKSIIILLKPTQHTCYHFCSKKTKKFYDSILNEQFTFRQFLSQINQRLLAKEPNKRLGVHIGDKEILQLKWFKKVNLTHPNETIESSKNLIFRIQISKLNFKIWN
ncbi:unnamed protein product [Paramecium octaurelia]|uniref:Uncharacterized protein n=1 Tax=Paramecium octaurelia TaxID=43137 RepID=A0A8S1U0K6_PAROT|nr:unnamed protein product [Paramecium octaurelia]